MAKYPLKRPASGETSHEVHKSYQTSFLKQLPRYWPPPGPTKPPFSYVFIPKR